MRVDAVREGREERREEGEEQERQERREGGREEERENKKEISYSRGKNLAQTEATFLCSHKKRDPGILLSHG